MASATAFIAVPKAIHPQVDVATAMRLTNSSCSQDYLHFHEGIDTILNVRLQRASAAC